MSTYNASAYAEFITGLSPEKVGRYLSAIADSMIEVGLQFVMKRLIARRGEPQRPDGTVAEVAVIGLGNLGGNEMSYNSPLKLVFLYDSIDNHNVWHRDFYSTLVDELVGLLRGDPTRTSGLDVDLREGPRSEVGIHICSFREAIRIYETAGRTHKGRFCSLNCCRIRDLEMLFDLSRGFTSSLCKMKLAQFDV